METPRAGQGPFEVQALSVPDAPDFRVLFDAEYAYVLASLRRLGVRDSDRDDAAIEVFCRVHARLASYDARRPLRPWIFAFAARVASEHRRRLRRSREVGAPGGEIAAPGPSPSDAAEASAARGLVLAALDVLDDDRRAVFVLHDIDECPVPQIAAALGLPEGTVYTRLRAARARFADAVRRLRDGDGRASATTDGDASAIAATDVAGPKRASAGARSKENEP